AADTDEEAEYIASSLKRKFLHLAQGITAKFQPPTEEPFSDYEEALFTRSLDPLTTMIGSKETIERKLQTLLEQTATNELIISSSIYDQAARLRSLEIIAQLFDDSGYKDKIFLKRGAFTMSYKQLKWLILLIPTITVGLWEYLRHEYLLPYISMDLGNWLTPVIVLFITFTLVTHLFSKIEAMQEQLHRERTEKVALEERERIARELHDGMAQSLFLLSVKMKQLKQLNVAAEDEEKLLDLEQSVVHIHDYVRTGIENLREPVLDEIYFLQTVEAAVESFEEESGLGVEQDIILEESSLTTQEKRELLFCLKEALMNIHKHANAGKVDLFIRI